VLINCPHNLLCSQKLTVLVNNDSLDVGRCDSLEEVRGEEGRSALTDEFTKNLHEVVDFFLVVSIVETSWVSDEGDETDFNSLFDVVFIHLVAEKVQVLCHLEKGSHIVEVRLLQVVLVRGSRVIAQDFFTKADFAFIVTGCSDGLLDLRENIEFLEVREFGVIDGGRGNPDDALVLVPDLAVSFDLSRVDHLHSSLVLLNDDFVFAFSGSDRVVLSEDDRVV